MLEFKNVHKYFGENRVLQGIDFKIKKGEIVFLLGISGTGKSVTLKLIVGLMNLTLGEIWVDGENITNYSEREFSHIRRKCGMVFQHPALFDSLSVFENVAFGLRKNFSYTEEEIKQRVSKCLNLVRVYNSSNKLPQEISYGTQKRVSLARTVAIEPKILLFDEPTTGLDPIATKAVNRLIQDLSREIQTTSIVVSHDMNCALDIADRIIVLDKGQVVEQGTPDEIRRSEHPVVKDFILEVKNE